MLRKPINGQLETLQEEIGQNPHQGLGGGRFLIRRSVIRSKKRQTFVLTLPLRHK